jgi:excisionase family DNA binding protein
VSSEALRQLQEQYPPIITTSMVAQILGLNVRTILLMAQDGRLPASRIPGSRSYRYYLADVVRMLDDNRLVPEPGEQEHATAKGELGGRRGA